jgi:hypothetical protein
MAPTLRYHRYFSTLGSSSQNDHTLSHDFGNPNSDRRIFRRESGGYLNGSKATFEEGPVLADTVAKVENRTTPKISRKVILRRLYR